MEKDRIPTAGNHARGRPSKSTGDTEHQARRELQETARVMEGLTEKAKADAHKAVKPPSRRS